MSGGHGNWGLASVMELNMVRSGNECSTTETSMHFFFQC